MFIPILLFSFIIVNIQGGPSLSVKIDGVDTILTTVDVTANTDNEVLNIDGFDEEFTLNPIWAIFALKEGREYNLKIWDIAGNCGCSNQVCGVDCLGVKGEDCDSNVIDTPLTCLLSPRKGFCWAFVEAGNTQNYTLYNLSHVGLLALTSYSGPAASFVSPGFTIQSQFPHQDYSLNAMIIGFTTRQQTILSNYYYAESEGRVISFDEFAFLNSKPNLTSSTVQLEESTCPQDGHPVFKNKKIIQNLAGADNKIPFRSYMILRKGRIAKIESLLNRYILSPNGIMQWNVQKIFDIFDPCNQQFLSLQKDKLGNIFVKLPATQSLINDDIICVAMNDVNTNIYDLVLYELKNATSIWKASDRFRGILSRDYVGAVQLRMTVKSSSPIQIPQAKVEVTFEFDTDVPILRLKSSIPLNCEIFLSPDCIWSLGTTKEHLVVTKSIGNSCGYLYESGRYMCEWLSGNFYPPSKFVQAPISGFIENTTAREASSLETISALNTSINNSRWRNLTFFEKSVMIIFICLIVFFSIRSRKSKQTATEQESDDTDEKQKLTTNQGDSYHLTDDIDEDNDLDIKTQNRYEAILELQAKGIKPNYKLEIQNILNAQEKKKKNNRVCINEFLKIYEYEPIPRFERLKKD